MVKKEQAAVALACLGFLVLASRFFFMDWAPFINDEPKIQLLLSKYLAAGEFPALGIPGGTQGLPYGPGALWMYRLLRFISTEPIAVLYWHACFITGAILLVFVSFRRLFTGFHASLIFLLLVSSPYLAMYTRLAWNNTFVLFFTSLVLYGFALLQRQSTWRFSPAPFLCLGIGLGMALNTHLLAGPLLLAAAVTLLVWFFTSRMGWVEKSVGFVLATVVALVICLPYFMAALAEMSQGGRGAAVGVGAGGAKHWGDGKHVWWSFLQTSIHLSFWKMKYFFHYSVPDFYAFCGSFVTAIFRADVMGFLLKLVAWFVTFAVGWRIVRFRKVEPVALFAFLSLGFVVFVLVYANTAIHPHYYHACFWVAYWALGFFLEMPHLRIVYRSVLGCIGALIVLNFIYQGFFVAYVVQHQGIRSHYYGATIGNKIAVTREACSQLDDGAIVDVTQVDAMSYPFTFLQTTEPACAGKKLHFIYKREDLPPHSGVQQAMLQTGLRGKVQGRLVYRSSESARLYFERIGEK